VAERDGAFYVQMVEESRHVLREPLGRQVVAFVLDFPVPRWS